MKIYNILHLEYMNFGLGDVVDEITLHVASTLKKAEDYIKNTFVCAYSWWEIHEFEIDKEDSGTRLAIYNHRGKKLDKQPYEQALKAWRKEKAKANPDELKVTTLKTGKRPKRTTK